MPKPLREEINEVVVKYLQRQLQADEAVDVAYMAREMAQSLVDMFMEQEEQQQAPLLAQVIVTVGDEYLQRCGLIRPLEAAMRGFYDVGHG